MMIQEYQNNILRTHDIVPYDQIVMQAYPPELIRSQPFVSFRVLLRDARAGRTPQETFNRLAYLDHELMEKQILIGSGCIIREASAQSMPDGLWLATFPVPRVQMSLQFRNLFKVISILEMYGITVCGLFEVGVSGRVYPTMFQHYLDTLDIPSNLWRLHVPSTNTPFSCPLGHCITINDEFTLIRTRWNMCRSDVPTPNPLESLKSTMDTIALKLASVFN
jgi:hypothetical protein